MGSLPLPLPRSFFLVSSLGVRRFLPLMLIIKILAKKVPLTTTEKDDGT